MKESMINFRKARDTMGFRHTSAYVPNAKLTDFSIYVERLKAERMMELLDEPLDSEARVALSQCNYAEVPTPNDFNNMLERYKGQKEIGRQIKVAKGYIESYLAAAGSAKMSTDAEEYIKWQSIAVANNAMAAVVWREIIYAVQEAETRRGV